MAGHSPWQGSNHLGREGYSTALLPGTAQLPAACQGCMVSPKTLGSLLWPRLAAHQSGGGAELTVAHRVLFLGTHHPQGLSPPAAAQKGHALTACRDTRGGSSGYQGRLLFLKHCWCPLGVLGLGQEQRRHWESHQWPWGAGMEVGTPLPRGGRSVWWDSTRAERGWQHTARQPAPGKWLMDRITLSSRMSQLPRCHNPLNCINPQTRRVGSSSCKHEALGRIVLRTSNPPTMVRAGAKLPGTLRCVSGYK